MSALGRELRCDHNVNAVSRARDQHGLALPFSFSKNSPEAIGPSRWNQRAGKSRRQYNAPIAVYAAVLRGGSLQCLDGLIIQPRDRSLLPNPQRAIADCAEARGAAKSISISSSTASPP